MGGNPKLKGRSKDDSDPHALSLEGPIVDYQCWIQVGVASALVIASTVSMQEVDALIDTGATSSSVNIELAKKLGLVGRTKLLVHGAGGAHECEAAPAFVGFRLPSGTVITRTVSLAILPMSVPMLFGMADITPGCLIVDGPSKKWRWRLPKASVT